MKNFFTNWKTTSTGILMILGSIYGFVTIHPIDQPTFMTLSATALTGIGLLFAKDGDVTGGTKQA